MPSERPAKVADLGTGSGAIALSIGTERPHARILATDASGDALEVAQRNARRLCIPNVQFAQGDWFAPLDDLHGARGWAAQEHAGLGDRLTASADLVLMLALIHHLAIGCAVPLEQVARFAFRCTRHALVVEILNEDDPQLQALCRQRRRDPGEFSVRRQREAFMAAGFRLGAEQRLDGAARSLLLLIK